MGKGDLEALRRLVRDFASERDWEQFHTPKNLTMALSVEAAELLEHFQWLTPEEAERLGKDEEAARALASEIADVAIYLLRLADVLGVDVADAVRRKVEENDRRFPSDRVRGRATLPREGEGE